MWYVLFFSHWLCVDQLRHGEYSCQKVMNGWIFIVVSEQNDSEKQMSTALTFWTIATLPHLWYNKKIWATSGKLILTLLSWNHYFEKGEARFKGWKKSWTKLKEELNEIRQSLMRWVIKINLSIVTKNEIIIILLKLLVVCTIFLKLTKYFYFHSHSINIYIIYKFKHISWSYK